MALNTHKTKTVLVTGKRLEKKIVGKALKIACNGNQIEQVTSQKLTAEVKLDSQLISLNSMTFAKGVTKH